MRSDLFSPLELSFLEQLTWFKSLRLFEQHPKLATPDFAARVKLAAESSDEKREADVLLQTSLLIDQVVAVGLDAARKEKIGESGVLAGEAREARERYYESRQPADLVTAVDQFVLALLQDDDPLLFDHGGTLQGFAATLWDLAKVVESPLIHHVGCLAFLGCMTACLAAPPPQAYDSWVDDLARATTGVRDHLDALEEADPDQRTADFYASARKACDSIEGTLEGKPTETSAVLTAGFPAMCLALACIRIDLPVPSGGPRVEPEFLRALEAWLSVVLSWIDRYGSDFLRLNLVMPDDDLLGAMQGEDLVTGTDEDRPSSGQSEAPTRSVSRENPSFAAHRSEIASVTEAVLQPAKDSEAAEAPATTSDLLQLAVMAFLVDPQQACLLIEQAQTRLDAGDCITNNGAAERSEVEAFLRSRETLAALIAAVSAFIDLDVTQFQRFHNIRKALPPERLEQIVAVMEPTFEEFLADPTNPPTRDMQIVAQTAMIVHDLASALTAGAVDIGLPEADRYRAVSNRLMEVLFGEYAQGGFVVHPETPGYAEMGELIVRFTRDPGSLDDAESEKVCEWLGAAYEAGNLTFALVEQEVALLTNLGWLHLRARRPETLKWTARARQLALRDGAFMDVATADINAASCLFEVISTDVLSWSSDDEQVAGYVHLLTAGLAYAAEALRIISSGWELEDSGHRYFLNSVGYWQVRHLIEGFLVEARDASLLAEYLLNARGMWFLLDLYDTATAEGPEKRPERPVISWRQRSWIAQSLPVDTALSTAGAESAPTIELAEILAPKEDPEALWFGNMVDPDSGTLASVLIVPPKQFVAEYTEDADLSRIADGKTCLEVALALGELLPETLWLCADTLCEAGERKTLFVSLDVDLPPVSMGLWRRPGEGAAAVVAEAFDVVYCPSLVLHWDVVRWVDERRAATSEVFTVCDPLGDLPEARIVPELAKAICGNGDGGVRPPANRETVLEMIDDCALADGIFIYQGHSESGALNDPEAAGLLLEPVEANRIAAERLGMGELLQAIRRSESGRMPRRAAFLSCGSGVATPRHDATGIAMAALAGGADAVISTLRPVSEAAPWRAIVGDLVDTLGSATPWQAFGQWQQRAAADLGSMESEEARWAVASLAMFGAPFARPDFEPGARDE